MRLAPALLAAVVHGGCLHAASQTCGNGGVCPPGLLCVDTGNTTIDSRICAAGTCGNGRLDQGEACDDGNNRSGDGCPADCRQPCGDGVRDPGEVCDDGNIVDGDGCSADCLSLDGVFLVSPPMVRFSATEGDAAPTAVTIMVRLEYRGDMAFAGYAPDVPQPTWLSIKDGPSTPTTAEFELTALDTLFVGERSTSVHLLINHKNSTDLRSFDLPVTLSVAPSDLAIQSTPETLAFTAFVDDVAVPSQALTVNFNGEDVMLVSAPSWATVTASKSPTSPRSFAVSVSDASFAAGTRLSDDIVFRTTRALVQRTATVHVSYSIAEAPTLAIEAMPADLAFTASIGDAPPPSRAVNVAFTGTSVAIASAPSWITVSGLAVAATSPMALTVSVNTTSVAAGPLSDDIVFKTTRGTSQEFTTIHVSYDVAEEHRIVAASSAIGFTSSPAPGRSVLSRSVAVTSSLGRNDVRWHAIADQAWLHVTSDGMTGQSLTLVADPTGIDQDVMQFATVIVTSPDAGVGNQELIRVGLRVNSRAPEDFSLTIPAMFAATSPIEPLMFITSGGTSIAGYDTDTGALVRSFQGVAAAAGQILFGRDGRRLYIYDTTNFVVVEIDALTGTHLASYNSSQVNTVQPVGGGFAIARPGGHEVLITPSSRMYDLASGTEYIDANFRIPSFFASLTPSLDGSDLVNSEGGVYRLHWTALRGGAISAEELFWTGTAAGAEGQACIRADNAVVYTASGAPYNFPGTSMATRSVVQVLPGQPYPLAIICLWNGIVVGGIDAADNNIFVYDGPSGISLGTRRSGGLARRGLSASADGARLISVASAFQGPALDVRVQSLPAPLQAP